MMYRSQIISMIVKLCLIGYEKTVVNILSRTKALKLGAMR